jgi:2-polyprenyl-6-methoxyphenol hydroxylase-like FAD-dependent oxidoreductase
LFEYAARRPNIVMRFGWEVTGYEEGASGVTLTAVPATGGAPERWRVQYLAGCDGGRSLVRRQAGIGYQGEPGIEQRYLGGRMFSTYVRAPALYRDVLRPRRAWQYWAINPEIRSVLISVNGNDEFLLRTQAQVPDQTPDDAAVVEVMRHCAGVDTPIKIIAHEPWTAGMALVAESFGRGRVWLAGDAVHLFTPTGGFGMNTGIDDAANLAWKLAAVVQGWGGPQLVDTYEIERKPIAARNTGAARQLTMNIGATDVDPAIERNTPAGEAARRKAGTMLAGFGEQFASLGVQFGARYDGSPLVAEDGAPPADDFINYMPSSVPGGRAPHVWLDGRRDYGGSLFDRLGPGFTLLRLGGKAPSATAMIAAAGRAKVPLKVLDVPDGEARDLYDRDLALIRPDQHVAWRGNAPAADPERLFAQATGWPKLTA